MAKKKQSELPGLWTAHSRQRLIPVFTTAAGFVTTPLRQKMIDDLKIRNHSGQIIKHFVYYIAKFAEHFRRSPEKPAAEHGREYQIAHSSKHEDMSRCRELLGATADSAESTEPPEPTEEQTKLSVGWTIERLVGDLLATADRRRELRKISHYGWDKSNSRPNK